MQHARPAPGDPPMPLLPRRYERLRSVLNRRMGDLTVLLEQVDKPHNLSAILRTCDAVGVLESHVVSLPGRPRIFNDTALGSQKWVPLHAHATTEEAIATLKARGFRLFGTHLSQEAIDYRDCDFTGPTAFLLGAEKWGLSEAAAAAVDQAIVIPMTGIGTAIGPVGTFVNSDVAGTAPTNTVSGYVGARFPTPPVSVSVFPAASVTPPALKAMLLKTAAAEPAMKFAFASPNA